MSINNVRNTVSTSITTPTVSAAPARYYSVAQLESLLAKIESKYPKLDSKLTKERAILEDIKDSDTWEGLKWYEVLCAPFAIKSNKMMIRGQRDEVKKLEEIVEHRDAIVGLLNTLRGDTFERA